MALSNITLSQLRAFAAVVDENGFSNAALKLGMTQSSVSHAITSLEAALGVPLLARQRGGVTPTAVGAEILADARQALACVEHIQQCGAAAHGLASARLRVGTVNSAAERLLPAWVRFVRSCYPGIEIEMFRGCDSEVADWVASGIMDVGITSEAREGMQIRVVAEDAFLIVVSESHPLAAQRSAGLDYIATEPFIMSQAGCEPAIRVMFKLAGIHPRVAFAVRDMTTLLGMVREGLGVTIVPELALPKQHAGLRILSITPPQHRRLFAVTRPCAPPPGVNAFLAVISDAEPAARF